MDTTANGRSRAATASLFGLPSATPGPRSLVDLDPELFAGLGPRNLLRVREIAPHVVELACGRWEPPSGGVESGLGLVVLDGLMVGTTNVGAEVATEIIGAGDVIRPWEGDDDDGALVPSSLAWTVLQPTRMALLGRQVAFAAADCPVFLAALLERIGRRSRSQRILTAIAHTKRIDLRLLLLLWHLAERWGRVTADGVTVPLRLTHERLALLVGARRPSVTAALSRMATREIVLRTPDRGFLLTPAAGDQLNVLSRNGERAIAPVMSACA